MNAPPSIATVDDLVLSRTSDADVESFVNSWTPYYFARLFKEPDWTYRLFPWERIVGHPGMDSFAARSNSRTEGLIALRNDADALKIEFLSTAPWNHGRGKVRQGVGSALLGFAAQVSMARGYAGAIVLSSTPESEGFYARMGFAPTGTRDGEDLVIFHLAPDRASRLLVTVPLLTSNIDAVLEERP